MYDIDSILFDAANGKISLAHDDEREWAKLAAAVKTLKGDAGRELFFSMSWGAERVKADKWRCANGSRWGINTPDEAAAVVVGMAKSAGANMACYTLSPDRTNRPTTARAFPAPPKPTAAPPVVYVGTDVLQGMENDAAASNLFAYLCTLFPREDVAGVFRRYRVGAMVTNNGFEGLSTVFPLINAAGKIVDLRIVPYGENGHRLKDVLYPVGSYMAMKKLKENRGALCLFGEHLAPSVSGRRIIGIVESEKTALMASLQVPKSVFMATTSLTNLTAGRLEMVKGMECKVFPDNDKGFDVWRDKVKELNAQGYNLTFCGDFIRRHAQGENDDLGDIIESWRK